MREQQLIFILIPLSVQKETLCKGGADSVINYMKLCKSFSYCSLPRTIPGGNNERTQRCPNITFSDDVGGAVDRKKAILREKRTFAGELIPVLLCRLKFLRCSDVALK